ncbi:hypothetical protein F2P56_008374 [Juglans regia]|uniref:Uncharacterized protein LOC108981986 n=2 Tax=Juglans regia TaxID=51240 RepID=A0A2I4DNR7_JUGRE|nr:uncharacterized protein LOC108981986 [Juglans regia]KAF5471595.1 hypothetical protein F2P56_008374 [Juglans regia]
MALQGSSFCYNGDASIIREVHGLPCSFVKSFAKPHHLSKTFPKQYGIVLAKPFGQGCRIRVLPNCCRLSLQTRRSRFLQQASGLVSLRPCQVKREDTQDPLGGESIIMDEQILEQDLQIAIAEENYVEAAKIRDSLKNLHEDSKTSVLLANARFYDSFRTGDLAAMQTLWTKGNEACVVHPGASGISGYDDIMESWEFVWADYEFPLEIQLKDVRVHVKGDVGYVTCREFVKTEGSKWGVQFATNVFERIDGQWFICIHHASPVDL